VVLLIDSAAAQDASSTANEEGYARVVSRAVDHYLVPAYGDLQGATGELGPALNDLCLFGGWSTGSYERNSTARAFASTVEAWAAIDFLRFGPMARDSRYERFAFWPDVHGTGARQLRQFVAREDPALLEPGALARQSAAVQGLPALESLLFSGSNALVETEAPEPYRCELARRIVGNLNSIATEALLEWKAVGGWSFLIENPGPENPVYRDNAEALREMLRAILTGLEQMREHRLLPALGIAPEEAKASRAPYNRSGQALAYLQAAAEALERFVEASRILDLVPVEKKWIANSIGFEFENLRSALGSAGTDLEAALADRDARAKLVYATIVLASLRDLFQNRLAPAIGLTAVFNSLDGD
jgi:predicted lipoprotein